MQPVARIAVAFLVLIALAQLTRFLMGWDLVVNGFRIPVWASAVAAVAVGFLAAMLWRESRR